MANRYSHLILKIKEWSDNKKMINGIEWVLYTNWPFIGIRKILSLTLNDGPFRGNDFGWMSFTAAAVMPMWSRSL